MLSRVLDELPLVDLALRLLLLFPDAEEALAEEALPEEALPEEALPEEALPERTSPPPQKQHASCAVTSSLSSPHSSPQRVM